MPVYIPSKKQNPKQEPAYRPPPSYENPISSYYDNAQDSVVNTVLAFDEDTGGGLLLAKPPRRKKRNRKKIKYLQYERLNTGKVEDFKWGKVFHSKTLHKDIPSKGIRGTIKVMKNNSILGEWNTIERMNGYHYLPPGEYTCMFIIMRTYPHRSIRVLSINTNHKDLTNKTAKKIKAGMLYFHGTRGDPINLLGCIGVGKYKQQKYRDKSILDISQKLYKTEENWSNFWTKSRTEEELKNVWKKINEKKVKLIIKGKRNIYSKEEYKIEEEYKT